jgi:ATP-binding cassette subfamily B multidrug efflux pump
MTHDSASSLKRQLIRYWRGYSKPIIIGAISIILIDASELWLPLLLRDTIDAFSSGQPSGDQKSLLIQGLFLVVGLQVVGRYVWRVALSRSSMLAGAAYRREFANQSFLLSIPRMESRKVGELMNLATSDVENMRFAIGPGFIAIIDAAFYCLTLPVAMFLLAPDLAWRVILPLLMIPVVVLMLQGRISQQSKIVQQKLGRLGSLTQEMIAGIRLIKSYGVKDQVNRKLNDESHSLNQSMVQMMGTQARLNPSMEFFLSTSMVLLFASGEHSIGTLVAMQRYVQRLLWPLTATAMAVIYFQKAKSSGADFFRFMDESDLETSEKDHTRQPRVADAPIIEARNLRFAFPDGKIVFDGLNLKIQEGEWVGIAGPVGAGKSIFLQLLLKFYPVEKGMLFIRGSDVAEQTHEWVRSHFSPVLQDPYLFQGTLQENLQLGEDDHPLSWSMQVSGMRDEEFSHRMDQRIGERGVGLSGGQKQRVAIARAIRRNSPVLLLDDPLSSVDEQTAGVVLGQLSKEIRKMGRTVVLVSHHESHLEVCDRVVRW